MQTLTEITQSEIAHRALALRFEQLQEGVKDCERTLGKLKAQDERAYAKTLVQIIELANTLPDAIHHDSVGNAMASIPGGVSKLILVGVAQSAFNGIAKRAESHKARKASIEKSLAAYKAALAEEFPDEK